MASSTESDCHKDPNFAVICSFIDKYGESLGLPQVSYSDLERYLQDNTNNVSRVLIDIHVRLLRRIGKSSVTSDRFEKSIIKFCHHFSEFDAWEVESYGYKHANVRTKLRILKNLLECQFDYNIKFKEKVNESSAEEMRFMPIGRDKEGQAYWYFLDNDLNLLIYKEEQDDEDADTWQLVCSDRQQLANLVDTLKDDAVKEVKDEDDKTSTESRSSKEGSPDKEMCSKEENDNGKSEDAQKRLKQEPDLVVKEEPVERDKKEDHSTGSVVKVNSVECDIRKKSDRKGGVKGVKEKEIKLIGKVELNVSIKRLSEESVEKYKKRRADQNCSLGVKKELKPLINIDREPESHTNEQKKEGKDKEVTSRANVSKADVLSSSEGKQSISEKPAEKNGKIENVETQSGKESVEKITFPRVPQKDTEISQSGETKPREEQNNAMANESIADKNKEEVNLKSSSEEHQTEKISKENGERVTEKVHEETLPEGKEENTETDKSKQEKNKSTGYDKNLSEVELEKPAESESTDKDKASCSSRDDNLGKSGPRLSGEATKDYSVVKADEKVVTPSGEKGTSFDSNEAQEKSETVENENVSRSNTASEECVEKLSENEDEAAKNVLDAQAGSTSKEMSVDKSIEEPQASSQDKETTVASEDSIVCSKKIEDTKSENISEKAVESVDRVEEYGEKEEEKTAKDEPSLDDASKLPTSDKNLLDTEAKNDEDPAQSELPKDPDKSSTTSVDMSKEKSVEIKSKAALSDAEEEDFTELGDDEMDEIPIALEETAQKDDDHEKEKEAFANIEGNALVQKVDHSDTESTKKSGSCSQETDDSKEKGHGEVKDEMQPVGKSEKDIENSQNAHAKTKEVFSSSPSSVVEEPKESVIAAEKTEPEKEDKDRNTASQSGLQANSSNTADTGAAEEKDIIASDHKEQNMRENLSSAEKPSVESDESKSAPQSKKEDSENQKDSATKLKQNDQGSETTESEEKSNEVQSTDEAVKPSKTPVCNHGDAKPISSVTLNVGKSSESPLTPVTKVNEERPALANGPEEEEKEKDVSVEIAEEQPSQSDDKKGKEVVNGVTEKATGKETPITSDTIASDMLESSVERVEDQHSSRSESKNAEQKNVAEKTSDLNRKQKEDGLQSKDGIKECEKVKESKSNDDQSGMKEREHKEEKKVERETIKSETVDKGHEEGDKSKAEGGQSESIVEKDEQGEEEKSKEDKVKYNNMENEGEKKAMAEKAQPCVVEKPENEEEERQSKAEGVDNVKKDKEKKQLIVQAEQTTDAKKEASNVSGKKNDENKDQEQSQTAGLEDEIKKVKDDPKTDETDAKSDKAAQPQKKTRGSITTRNLKRAAPEPASDEVIESEPNGKRARPTTRVVKTRGGRNAAARGRASRLVNKESESEDSESVAPAKSKRGVGRGRGRGGRGRGTSRNTSANKKETEDKKAREENDEDGSDQATGKRAKKKKPDSSSEALSEEEVTPAKKGRNQIQSKKLTRGGAASRGNRRGGRGGGKGAAAKKTAQPPVPVQQEEDGSRRRSARVKEMRARRPPTPSSPEEESEPTEEEDEDEEDFEPEKFFLEGSFTPEEESGDEEFKPKGRNFQRQAARTIQEKNEVVINDDTPCVKCGKYNHPEMILLCDKCDAGYHTACLRPPLMVIPDGDWFCPPCEHSMLVERLFACLQSLDIALKKKDRLSKRQERLAYVGISINNILHGDRPVHVSDKFDGKHGNVKEEEEGEEEEEEEAPSEASSSYESEEEVPERKFRSERLAMRQAEKRSRREKHKRRKTSRAQSPESEVFAKRTCRTRNAVSYQFKEFDELISNAIDDDQPVRKEKPPGRSRGKDMSNILGASDEEDEKIRKRDQEEGAEPPIPVVRKKPKRRLTGLDSDDDEEVEDDSEEFKLSEDEDSDATEVEDADDGEGDEDELTEENSDSGDWKPKKTWYNSRNNRSSRRRKLAIDEDDYDSDENASKRRSTRNSTRGRITYDDWDSEEETEVETEEEEESSFSDFSSDDSRFTRKMKREKEKRQQKAAGKESKNISKRKGDRGEEESEGSVSDSSIVRKRKMLMKLVKKRRKDESGNEDTEEAEVSKNETRTRKAKRKTFSEDSSASFDEEEEEEESGSDDESDQPRSKKKNVLRSSDEDEPEKPTNGETATPDEKTEVIENNNAVEVETSEAKVSEEPLTRGPGKRGLPSKAQAPVKGKKRSEDINNKIDGNAETKDEPVPGKVRRLSGSDKEGDAEPNPPLEMPALQKKAQPTRRGRAASKEGEGEASSEKKGPAVGNRRSSTDKQTRSGKKKRLPNFLNVPSGGESEEEEVKVSAAADTISKLDQPVSSAQAMSSGAQQPTTGLAFPSQQNQGPQSRGYQANQRLPGPQSQQFNTGFPTGQMGATHIRPALSSPPHSMANVTTATAHEESSSTAQVPPHYSVPPGHPGGPGLAAANMRGPYPKYNGAPVSQMPQGMPPHMMNQALEPGQIPSSNINQPPHVRHPSQPMAQPPPHSMGHDQSHPRMMQQQQQQWNDHRAPSQQPPGYGNPHRMSYPREMVPRQPYYHMRSPPPHNMGQYPPHMASSVNNPLTSMGQMTRNLSPGMKSPPPRPAGEAGGEEGKPAASQDTQIKQEISQEAPEKGREADSASPEKGAGKMGGKRAKASSPKSHSEKPEGEESSTHKPQAQPVATAPSQSSHMSQPAQPVSSSAMPYQQHPYINSQQGFYMPQHYRMPYGGPNQGPVNQMQGVPPYHNQYMNPNQPFPHRPYLPPGQPQQMTNMPPNPMSGQNPPPNSMPSQQNQSNIGPSQSMPSSMPANPNIPFNQQRPPPMNTNQQAQHGTPDAAMMPPTSYPQRPPGMAPNHVSGPSFMPGYSLPSSMPHPGMPQGAHGMQPAQPMRSQGAPQNQTGPQQGVTGSPANQPNPQRMPQPQLPQGSVGMAPNQQPPVSMPSHGNMPTTPATSQGEQTSGQAPHLGPGPQMVPYYQMQPGQQPPVGVPTLPPPPSESKAQQKVESESGKTPTEPKRSKSPTGNHEVSETDGPQEQKPTTDTPVKKEPKATSQEAQLPPPPQAYPQGEIKPPQGGGANTPNTVASNLPVSQCSDPVAMPNANNRSFPPTSMGQGHPHPSGQGPPMPYYNPGPYYQPYRGNMPPQGEHMHSQVRWGSNMPPYGPRYGGHPYPPYGMGPEAMNMNMMPGQGMHGNAGVPHPQSTPSGGPMGVPPHTSVSSTPPHSGLPQDFQTPRDQPAAVRNRRSSSTDSRPNLPPATGNAPSEAPPETPVSSSPHPRLSPSVSSPSTSLKSEQLPKVSSPSLPLSSSSSSCTSTTTTTVSTSPVSQQASASSSSPKSIPPKSENKDFPSESGAPPLSMAPQSSWSGPSMNHQYTHTMGQMHRMGAPGPYNVMPPYDPQGMMHPQPHNFYMMGPNPRQANSKGPGQANFQQYQGHLPPQPHGMNPVLGMNQAPMSYNGGYRPPYMAPGQEHLAMPPRPDFNKTEMQSGPKPTEVGSSLQNAAPDSQTSEGNAIAPKAKKAKTPKKKEPGTANSPRGKGTRGRGRGNGGFMIASLLQARGAGTGEEEGEETREMKDIVNYVTTDDYIKRQTSS